MKLRELCKKLDNASIEDAERMYVQCGYDHVMELCNNNVYMAAKLYGYDMEDIREMYADSPDTTEEEMLQYQAFADESQCLLYITDVKRLNKKFYIVIDTNTQAYDIDTAISRSLTPKEVFVRLVTLGADFDDEVKVIDILDLNKPAIYSYDIVGAWLEHLSIMLDISSEDLDF